MTRRVRKKLSEPECRNKAIVASGSELSDGRFLHLETTLDPDWTTLPDDTVIQLFSHLNYRDRASLSSTCQAFRLLGSSPCLWGTLDVRSHKFDIAAAESLFSRSKNILKVQFRGAEAADAMIKLQARGLREISCDFCRNITDATLSVLAARHEMLESIQLGLDACERITSDAIKAIALCCPKLRRLQLSGVCEVGGEAINALARHCGQLVEVAFIESDTVNEVALGNLASVQFLSVSGTRNLKWGLASQYWSKLPKLVGLDVSRTDISSSSIQKLLSLSPNLKVLFALNCPVFEADINNGMSYNHNDKLLVTVFNENFKAVASIFADTTENKCHLFSRWRTLKKRELGEIITWIEWTLSHFLLRIAECNPKELDIFWFNQGASLLVHLLQSSQCGIQERAAAAIATFIIIDEENATVDSQKAEAISCHGGIQMLLGLARSCHEGLQSEATKAIANLSVDSKVAKAVAKIGGINILADLAWSRNKLVAEEATGGLWNLSVGEELKGAIAKAGAIKSLVDLVFKWPSTSDGVLERAAGALANLAADEKCSMEMVVVGGVQALVMLLRCCSFAGVQEQAARALSNMATHGDSNSNNSAVRQEAGALEALVQLTCSDHEGVRQEAAGALWNLSFDGKNREAIAAAGGIVALVSLAKSCSNFSQGLQERAAGALWGLSVSEANSIAIGQEGGIPPLIALACSDVADIHETAAGALWNLAFNPGNALRIVEDGGVPALVRLCSSSPSKIARFMATLALAYMFDGRMDEIASMGPSSGGGSKSADLDGVKKMALKHIEEFVLSFSNPQTFATIVLSSAPNALAQIVEVACIPEAGYLRCSVAEIGRFVAMLRNPYSILRACSAFALFQFTMPGGRHTMHHSTMLQNAGAPRILHATAAAATAPIEAKAFAKIVLRNIEHRKLET